MPTTTTTTAGGGGGNSGLLVPVSGTRGTSPTAEGVKKGRKAAPDVQDIISGIVHLLGGKVNLHAASGVPEATPAPPAPSPAPSSGPSMLLRPQMLSAQSTRINNRAPPRLSEVPFEAIPLEAANAGSTQQQPQLPFGIPFRPPVWPAAMSQKPGQNVQELPYGTGIPLPVQLVPPVAPSNRPWPPQPAAASTSSSSLTSPSPTKASSSSELATTINFFPEDHGVRHPPAVLVSTPTPSLPSESTIASVTTTTTTTSSLDSIIQSSIEDVVTPSSSSQPVSLASQPAVKTTVVPSAATAPPPPSTAQVISSSSTVDQQHWLPPNTTPQLEAGSSSDSSAVSGFTPPLPAARPGQVFHDEYLLGQQQPQPGYGSYGDVDVITSDNIRPQGAYPDSFELVVSAAQNFGGSNNPAPGIAGAPVTGRPYVIPVSIDQVRQQPAAAVPLPSDGDEYVSIDGRKTYFNLYPTDVVNGPDSVVQPTIMPDSLPPVLCMKFHSPYRPFCE